MVNLMKKTTFGFIRDNKIIITTIARHIFKRLFFSSIFLMMILRMLEPKKPNK